MNQLNKTIILWSPECLCLRSFTTPWKECVVHESGTVLAQASSTFKRASQPRRDEIIWNSWDGCCQWFNRNPRPILQECKQGISTADAHGVFCGECLRHPASIGFLIKEPCSLSSRSSSLLLLSTGFIPGRLSFLLAFVPRPTRPVKCEMTNE